jgi:uncharacterized integral membrane protein
MMRLFFLVLATAGIVVFGFSNMEHVEFSFLFGQTEVRLIFLMMTSFAVGALSAAVYRTLADTRRRARERELRVRSAIRRAALEEAEAE